MALKEAFYFACVSTVLLLRSAHSARQSRYTCTFETTASCDLHVETTRGMWTIGGQKSHGGENGPAADHTWGTQIGAYVYSGSSDNNDDTPLTPELSTSVFHMPSGEGRLSFYYFLWGTVTNVLNVYTVCDDVRILSWARGLTEPMETWARGEITITCPGSVKIIFESVHSEINSYIAIDDITIDGAQTIDHIVSMGTPTTTPPILDGIGADTDRPKGMMSTMPTGGVHNQPQETVTLSIALLMLALVFMVISVSVHCYIWRKRKRSAVQMRPKQLSVHNSGYNCPIHSSNHVGNAVRGDSRSSPAMQSNHTPATNAEKQSLRSSESSGIVDNGCSLVFHVPHVIRGRSKTVPNKLSIEHYESIEIGGQDKPGNSQGMEGGKRMLSDQGDRRKQGFLGKAHHFTRSNSLPSSPGNDFYESIDHSRVQSRPLAYQVTDLMPEGTRSADTVTNHACDRCSSNGSIPSIHINHLNPPTAYDNLERRSPLLTLPGRTSPMCSTYTPPSPQCANLLGSNSNITSIYNTPSASLCDITSLSSYDTLTTHTESSPLVSPQSNPFFQQDSPYDDYNSLNRHPGPSGAIRNGHHATSTPPSPDVRSSEDYTALTHKTKADATQQNEYHTLDPDAVSDCSFERSDSVEREAQQNWAQTKALQTVTSESSHDYEDLE